MVDCLVCVYVIDFSWRSSSQYSLSSSGKRSKLFLQESLNDLSQSLNAIGQQLLVIDSNAFIALEDLIKRIDASDLFRSDNAGWYENRTWQALKENNDAVNFHSVDSHTLFDLESLPFGLANLPSSFTKFKNAVSNIEPLTPIEAISFLPLPPPNCDINLGHVYKPPTNHQFSNQFKGGETHGLAHLNDYFATEKPQTYKQTRNAIDGWDNSTKLSPWLANGCLSARTVMSTLSQYEKNTAANESTYWINFELLWREYFQWYAHKNGSKLFSFSGIKGLSPLNSYYPERFQKWINGSTPYPLVNACMNELRETGYLSNRGRQIVASCFVNELAMDWRYGAAYFEQVLIDYDVASNWANWQYLAGVGADTRDKRHFNLEKQTQQFDPDGRYITLWNGDLSLLPLDSVDAADWPIS